MTHLDAGTITTLRDRGLVTDDARRHAEECPVCRQALADAYERQAQVEDLLESLQAPGPLDVASAKRKVRIRLDRKREAVHRGRPLFASALGRAAALLLVAAGVAYALPGSPLRSWLTGGDTGTPTPSSAVEGPPTVASEGVEVAVPATGLHIALVDVAPDMPVEIRWVEGRQARVSGGPGARYAVSESRTEVRVASGPIRLELPSAGAPLTVDADGRMILQVRDGRIDVGGEVQERDGGGLILVTGAR